MLNLDGWLSWGPVFDYGPAVALSVIALYLLARPADPTPAKLSKRATATAFGLVCVVALLVAYFWPRSEIEWAAQPFGPIVNGSRAAASSPMDFQVYGWDFKGKNLTTRTLHQIRASVESRP